MAEEPEVIRDKAQMRSWSRSRRSQGKTLALVPTMGFLHQGHLSLIREARSLAHLTVVSIYVNPGQFSPSEDLSTYPSDLHGDLHKLAEAGVDAVFCPLNLYEYGSGRESRTDPVGVDLSSGANSSDTEVGTCGNGGEKNPTHCGADGVIKVVSCIEDKAGGGLGHESWIRVEGLEKGLCGRSRPVFFRGVATIVAKLFNIVEPDIALFGKKDYQQWRIICRMVRDLDFAVKVIGSEIIREADGLAMSSRNVHLSPQEREKALSINRSLSNVKFAAQNGQSTCRELKNIIIQSITKGGGRIDYVEIVEQESLEPVEEIKSPVVMCVAAWFGKVRLIDNMEINI